MVTKAERLQQRRYERSQKQRTVAWIEAAAATRGLRRPDDHPLLAVEVAQSPAMPVSVPIGRLWCCDHGVAFEPEDQSHVFCHVDPDLLRSRTEGPSETMDGRVGQEPLRVVTGVEGLDRCLGGGLVEGSFVLLSGEPGCGKSTLLAWCAASCARRGASVLYASGEETTNQIKLRAQMIGQTHPEVHVLQTSLLEDVFAEFLRLQPHVVIVDSIQTLRTATKPHGKAGTDDMVRLLANWLQRLAKEHPLRPSVIVVAHVVKDGSMAGPKTLEHLADARLHIHLDDRQHRVLKTGKNRFGPSGEVAHFEFLQDGRMQEVVDLSRALLAEAMDELGTVAFPALHLARPVVLPVEVAVSPPREKGELIRPPSATGISDARLRDVLDLLREHAGFEGQRSVKARVFRVADGEVTDTSVDLALATAILSSAWRLKLPPLGVWGELSLSGKIRSDRQVQRRLKALHDAGLRQALGPQTPSALAGMEFAHVYDLEALARWVRRHGVYQAEAPRPEGAETAEIPAEPMPEG